MEFAMTKHIISGMTLVVAVIALSACGNTTTEKALSGAAIGAASGAVISETTGGSAATGAAIGGAAGAGAGAIKGEADKR